MSLYYQNLDVWKKSFKLAEQIHILIKDFPKEEQFVLSDQMRRSSISISCNIAEGSGRGGNAERNHFLHVAKGSAMELHTQLLFAQSFGYKTVTEISPIIELNEEIIKMLYAMTSRKDT